MFVEAHVGKVDGYDELYVSKVIQLKMINIMSVIQ